MDLGGDRIPGGTGARVLENPSSEREREREREDGGGAWRFL